MVAYSGCLVVHRGIIRYISKRETNGGELSFLVLRILNLIMKNYYNVYTLMVSVLLLSGVPLAAQQTTNLESGYTSFDQIVGLQNTSLYQGRLYTEKYRTVNDRKQFFKSTEFLNGQIWYKGQPYFNQLLKYDVFEDELLLKLEDNGNTLSLAKKEVDSFSLGQHYFVNLKAKKDGTGAQLGYCEVLFKDDTFVLYAKYSKKSVEKKDKKYIYYEFKDANTEYILRYKGEYYSFDSKKDIINIFPSHKEEIHKLYKRTENLSNNDDSILMTMIVKQLNSII
jgi:glycosyltransferase involved in cell wall biosynthesis